MIGSRGKASLTHARLRWSIWIGYMLMWSLALLTPEPARVRDAVFHGNSAMLSSKFLHVGGYLGLTILSGWLRLPVPYRWLLLAFLSLHAMGTEFFQQFVPLRGASLGDVGLDHIGILLGLVLTWKWWIRRADEAVAEPSSKAL